LTDNSTRAPSENSSPAELYDCVARLPALAGELGMPWNIVGGVGVIARAIGLVDHVPEELKNPLAREIKMRTEEEATSHRC
jgi:citrate synthase